MSMYQFVRGPRLFIQAAREQTDPDNVNQEPDDEMLEYGRDIRGGDNLHRVHTQRLTNTESHGTASSSNRVARKSGFKSITRKIIRKTTTLTRGEQRSVTERMVTQTGKDGQETVASPQRYVTERVVRTPWGTTDEDELDEGAVGYSAGPGPSGTGAEGSGKRKHTTRASLNLVQSSSNNGGQHYQHDYTTERDSKYYMEKEFIEKRKKV